MKLSTHHQWLFAIALLPGLSACGKDAPNISQATNAAEAITVENPRIRATAPGQVVSAAFMILNNHSPTPHVLTSATFADASLVEIHETRMQGNVMQMQEVGKVDIPANGSAELKPGSFHIMLMGLKQPQVSGTQAEITLSFSDNSQQTVTAAIADITE
ncbi:copper chaperone PCu(A)C [Thiothrix nivea]|uniref:Copper chaperone PCu(A)C n=1 Tax=Thiothrix nivea (strain ATCC 35100 / DSM 5205 / JP2) TaxID=870187 RepID=A0A656HHS9_THINJ|nr:copper chaperone PCu(A)C [Thiothrix nivea]EIJ35594.1 protein of unknown function DUF461 [Thiothrix nivea DSM 5205]